MQTTLQDFLAVATDKTMETLIKSFLKLPEDKRNWSPMGKSRTAINMMAECAIMNRVTISMIHQIAYPTDFDFGAFMGEMAELEKDWTKLEAELRKQTAAVIAAIKTAKSEDLDIVIPMPWGDYTFAEVISYPYWNMSYHDAQICYLASMLGCLD